MAVGGGGLKGLVRLGWCAGYGALNTLGLYRGSAPPVAYVTEKANWSIQWDARSYVGAIEACHPGTVAVTHRPQSLIGRVVHFGSQFHWGQWSRALSASNRTIVTYYHGKPADGPEMARHVDYFLANMKRLSGVVTASRMVERRLLDWGVPRAQLARVPLGVDTTHFRPPNADQRLVARAKWGVPPDVLCIGSFQKDGVGWGPGLEPKLIKGPDVFVAAVARLARDFPVFVLLTGPARGYVIKGLESHGVPFRHVFFDDYRDIVGCYHALDLYLMTSREEGGPKAVLESMASGVPLVATRTGMAEDVVEDGVNAYLAPVDNVETIVARAQSLLSDGASDFTTRGRITAEAYDWSIVSEVLYDTVYRELLA